MVEHGVTVNLVPLEIRYPRAEFLRRHPSSKGHPHHAQEKAHPPAFPVILCGYAKLRVSELI